MEDDDQNIIYDVTIPWLYEKMTRKWYSSFLMFELSKLILIIANACRHQIVSVFLIYVCGQAAKPPFSIIAKHSSSYCINYLKVISDTYWWNCVLPSFPSLHPTQQRLTISESVTCESCTNRVLPVRNSRAVKNKGGQLLTYSAREY